MCPVFKDKIEAQREARAGDVGQVLGQVQEGARGGRLGSAAWAGLCLLSVQEGGSARWQSALWAGLLSLPKGSLLWAPLRCLPFGDVGTIWLKCRTFGPGCRQVTPVLFVLPRSRELMSETRVFRGAFKRPCFLPAASGPRARAQVGSAGAQGGSHTGAGARAAGSVGKLSRSGGL